MIKKIQTTYDYDRTNAEKVLEYMRVKRVEYAFGTSAGLFAAWKFGPIQRELEVSQPIFRKAWMRFPMQLAAFMLAYGVSTQLPTRLMRKFTKKNTGVNNDTYTGEFDYVSRFRLFEQDAEAFSGPESA